MTTLDDVLAVEDPDVARELARRFLATEPDGAALVQLGLEAERLVDTRFLNAQAPDPDLFDALMERLEALRDRHGPDPMLCGALGTAGRIGGRRFDAATDAAHRDLLTMDPDSPWPLYNYGLFLKTRGRYREGLEVNLRALGLAPDEPPIVWNAAICATACGDAETALRLNHQVGVKAELGRHGLPDGTFPSMQVQLVERPLAERGPEADDPGAHETVWVERHSMCHGTIRSPLYSDLGVDYGDVVVFDGAAILWRRWGDQEVPVHPQLCTVVRPGYRVFAFAGTQSEQGGVAGLGQDLPDDAILYSHTESFSVVCADCWRDPGRDHAAHHVRSRQSVSRGKLCVGPHTPLVEVGRTLDAALAGRPGGVDCELLVPELWAALGDPRRAAEERVRMAMIRDS